MRNSLGHVRKVPLWRKFQEVRKGFIVAANYMKPSSSTP